MKSASTARRFSGAATIDLFSRGLHPHDSRGGFVLRPNGRRLPGVATESWRP